MVLYLRSWKLHATQNEAPPPSSSDEVRRALKTILRFVQSNKHASENDSCAINAIGTRLEHLFSQSETQKLITDFFFNFYDSQFGMHVDFDIF